VSNVKKWNLSKLKIWLVVVQAATVILYLVGLQGRGYNIIKYFIADKFQDFMQTLNIAQFYYSPILADQSNVGFSQPIGPPLIHYYLTLQKLFPSFLVARFEDAPMDSIAFYLGALILFLFILVYKIFQNFIVTFLVFFTYPVLFVFFRGNPDILLCILFALFILTSFRSNSIIPIILLSLMIAIKAPMAIFLIVYILQQKWLRLFQGFCFSAFFFLGGLILQPYNLFTQISNFRLVTSHYIRDYVLGDGGTLFNTSYFGLIKSSAYLFKRGEVLTIYEREQMNNFMIAMYPLALIMILTFLSFLLFFDFKQNKFLFSSRFQILVKTDWTAYIFPLTILYILIPNVSADYRLIFLIPAYGLLFRTKNDLITKRNFNISFGLLMIPKEFLFIEDKLQILGSFTISSVINPLLLIYLLFLSLYSIITREKLKNKNSKT
jgi:hypothetical protein